jgi:hypothetical protein
VIGKNEVPDRSNEPSDLPQVILVEITVLPNPNARTLRGRIAPIRAVARWPAVVALVLLVVILAAGIGVPGDRDGNRHTVSATAREPGPAGVAAAYGYPLRCLSITIVAAGQRYARADFDRASHCERPSGYSTAIFLRVMGVWRSVLRAIAYTCPIDYLPVPVQTELDVCPQPAGQTRRTQPRYNGRCPPAFERCRFDQAMQQVGRRDPLRRGAAATRRSDDFRARPALVVARAAFYGPAVLLCEETAHLAVCLGPPRLTPASTGRSDRKPCTKTCNKVGKFSLIQSHLRSENSCKSTPTLDG